MNQMNQLLITKQLVTKKLIFAKTVVRLMEKSVSMNLNVKIVPFTLHIISMEFILQKWNGFKHIREDVNRN